MQILFAISIVSFAVLAFAGFAIVRHIRADHRRGRSAPRESDFSQHLFRAAESRDMELPQTIRLQSVKEIAANKIWNAPSKLVEIPPAATPNPAMGRGKAPQSARPATGERLDWEYFNKDCGDLTDPYQSRPVRARSGIKSTSNRRS